MAPENPRLRLLLPALAGLALALGPIAATAQANGTIEGTIEVRQTPPRRTASRYAGAAVAARPIQPLPAVVYIEGAVPGAPARPRATPPSMAQHDTAFVPGVLVVPVGTAVEFPNEDPFFHNVFSYSGPKRFDLGRYPRGESKTVQFDEPGVVNVYCEVHESMRAAIIVVENPFHATVGADGAFRITGVPPGRYRLVAWHADHGTDEAEVEVRAGGTAHVTLRPS